MPKITGPPWGPRGHEDEDMAAYLEGEAGDPALVAAALG